MTTPAACVSIDVDTTLYRVSAVMRAAYKFTGKYHVAIRRPVEGLDQRVTVTLTPKTPSHLVDERTLAGDFHNELIDQRLRETLEAEFGPVRELIVAHAFSDTNLLDPARDDGDYVDDPLGIGLPGPQANAPGTSLPRRTTGASSDHVASFRDGLSPDRPAPLPSRTPSEPSQE